MPSDNLEERFSTSFLIAWIGLPAVALYLSLFWIEAISEIVAVTATTLLLAGLIFPLELRRFVALPPTRLLPLLLYLTPFFLASGRLSAMGWKAGAEFFLTGLWLGFVYFLWVLEKRTGRELISHYLFFFGFLSAGLPFLAYLFRDFGGVFVEPLFSLSPFILILKLAEGKGFEMGSILVLGLFGISFLAFRSVSVPTRGENRSR